jgi:integrase
MNTRGMGTVYQPAFRDRKTGEMRTAPTWWLCYYVNGQRIRESAETTNRAAAVRLLKRKTGDAANGKPVGPDLDRLTLADMIAMLEADYRANGRRTLRRALQAAAHLRDFFRGERKARDITPDTITAYAAHRLDQGAKPATVNLELAMLRRAFRLAALAGKLALRPEVSMLHVSNARQGFFEAEQFHAVLAHLPDHLKPLLRVGYITGWRRNELLTRQWRHVDLTNGWLRLDPGEGKTGQGRAFPFTSELRTIFEEQREHVRTIERAQGRVIPHVFVHPDGSPIRVFRRPWTTATRAAGVPGRLVHDLRRTAVRNLERAGVPRSAAMKLTGHATESVYRRYAIVDSSMLQDAAVKLGVLHDAESQLRQSNAKADAPKAG